MSELIIEVDKKYPYEKYIEKYLNIITALNNKRLSRL